MEHQQKVTFMQAVRSVFKSVILLTQSVNKVIQSVDDVASMANTVTGTALKEQQLESAEAIRQLEADIASKQTGTQTKLKDVEL